MKLRILFALLGTLVILRPSLVRAADAERRMAHISIVARGSGDPVILIPGLSSPRSVWDDIASEIAHNHRIILVQVNGFGGDDPGANARAGALDGAIADLSAYIAKNRLGAPDIIGHSMGGFLSLMMAKAHPDQVGRVMLVDSLPYLGTLFVPGGTVETVRPLAEDLRNRMLAATSTTPTVADERDPGGIMSITPEGRKQVARWSSAADRGAAAEIMYEVMTTDLRPDLAGIKTPITLLYPTSPAVPYAVAKAIYGGAYAAAPNAKLVEVADSYHFIMLDQPGRFASEVKAFLGK